jgi:hypothetical protein
VVNLAAELAQERAARVQLEARLAVLEAALDISGAEWAATLEVAAEVHARTAGPAQALPAWPPKRAGAGKRHTAGLFPPRPGAN